MAQSGSITRVRAIATWPCPRPADACRISRPPPAQLLERSARGVVPTAAGRLALQHAARLFQGFELFSNELSEHASGARGHVRLWANMSALVQFLPATLADFMARSPGTRVEVEEQLSGDIARAVQDGLADLGICAAGVPGAAWISAFSPRPAGGGGAGGPCAGRARRHRFQALPGL